MCNVSEPDMAIKVPVKYYKKNLCYDFNPITNFFKILVEKSCWAHFYWICPYDSLMCL